jgi:cobalt/nickel transport system permease protein
MHTPDGFLHLWMAGAFVLLVGAVLAVAAMRARDSLT